MEEKKGEGDINKKKKKEGPRVKALVSSAGGGLPALVSRIRDSNSTQIGRPTRVWIWSQTKALSLMSAVGWGQPLTSLMSLFIDWFSGSLICLFTSLSIHPSYRIRIGFRHCPRYNSLW